MTSPPPSPRIRRMTSIGRDGERVRLHLDDGSTREAPRTTVEELGLRAGDPVDAALAARLDDADLRARTRAAALRLLSHRSRSRSELAGRLRRKDFPGAVVATCLDRLERDGWVDDAAFARSLVRERLRARPRGRRALLAELRRKGVAGSVAEAAVEEVLRDPENEERDLPVEAAIGWLRRQGDGVRRALSAAPLDEDRERARRRLMGHLARRGFRGGDAVRALDAATERARGTTSDETSSHPPRGGLDR